MIRRIILLVVLALPISALAADFQVGFSIHLGTNWSTFGQVAPALTGPGFNTFRDEVFWHRLERDRGSLIYPDSLADLDRLVREAKARGLRPLLILNYGNKNFENGDLPTKHDSIAAFVQYARFVVRHFGDAVDQYEVWNEWNIGMGSPNKPRTLGSAAAYVNLLRPVYQMIKHERPNVQVVGGAVEGRDERWIDEFIALGGLKWLDVFSVHPYVLQKAKNSLPETSVEWLDLVHKKVRDRWVASEVPFFVTEVGWPTNKGQYGVSENVQAAYFIRFMLLARAREWIQGVWWYTVLDTGGDSSNREHRFGLLRGDLTPKPAYEAARQLVPLLKTAKFREISVGNRIRAVLVSRNSERRIFVWAEQDAFASSIPVQIPKILELCGLPSAGAASADSVSASAFPVELRLVSGQWRKVALVPGSGDY